MSNLDPDALRHHLQAFQSDIVRSCQEYNYKKSAFRASITSQTEVVDALQILISSTRINAEERVIFQKGKDAVQKLQKVLDGMLRLNDRALKDTAQFMTDVVKLLEAGTTGKRNVQHRSPQALETVGSAAVADNPGDESTIWVMGSEGRNTPSASSQTNVIGPGAMQGSAPREATSRVAGMNRSRAPWKTNVIGAEQVQDSASGGQSFGAAATAPEAPNTSMLGRGRENRGFDDGDGGFRGRGSSTQGFTGRRSGNRGSGDRDGGFEGRGPGNRNLEGRGSENRGFGDESFAGRGSGNRGSGRSRGFGSGGFGRGTISRFRTSSFEQQVEDEMRRVYGDNA